MCTYLPKYGLLSYSHFMLENLKHKNPFACKNKYLKILEVEILAIWRKHHRYYNFMVILYNSFYRNIKQSISLKCHKFG